MRINQKEYKLRYSGLTLILYNDEFNEDLLTTISGKDYNITTIFKILYVLIKTADKNQVGTFYEFMDSIEDITELLNNGLMDEIRAVIAKDGTPTKK